MAIATPPYRGVNPRMIEAWRFRARNVTPVITSMSFDVTLTPPPEPAR